MLRNPCEHTRTDFLIVVEGKYIIRPAASRKRTVRTALALDHPADTQESKITRFALLAGQWLMPRRRTRW